MHWHGVMAAHAGQLNDLPIQYGGTREKAWICKTKIYQLNSKIKFVKFVILTATTQNKNEESNKIFIFMLRISLKIW